MDHVTFFTFHPPSVRLLCYPPTATLCLDRRRKRDPNGSPNRSPSERPAEKGRDAGAGNCGWLRLLSGGRSHAPKRSESSIHVGSRGRLTRDWRVGLWKKPW
ncbi:hypothetical protein V8C37DRAFT_396185 [Trichoderma ceciliae]